MKGISGSYCKLDVTQSAQVNAVADQVHDLYGRIVVLVANTGIGHNTATEDIEDEEWLRVMNVNQG